MSGMGTVTNAISGHPMLVFGILVAVVLLLVYLVYEQQQGKCYKFYDPSPKTGTTKSGLTGMNPQWQGGSHSDNALLTSAGAGALTRSKYDPVNRALPNATQTKKHNSVDPRTWMGGGVRASFDIDDLHFAKGTKCGQWDPDSIAEVQALASLGAVHGSSEGVNALNSYANLYFDT